MYQNQTERMLADGGVMQEGGTVDEASGNEVPAGSLKEEVRDDVDAKLSVGEFVIPADVVRYIGLETLMKMRDKAKAGLKQMSDIGQMGNAEDAKEEDVGEFSSAVDEVMGEEEDDTAFSSAVDETMNEEKGMRKMAGGGYVQAENAATYANAPLKGFEMVSLVNDAGNVIYIPYVNGRPQLSIPSGYKVKTGAIDTSASAVTAPAATTATTGGISQTMTEGAGGGVSSGGPSSSVSSGLSGVVGSSVSPGMVGVVGSMIGGPIGLAMNLGKSMVADTLTSSIASQNASTVAAQMGLTAEEAASPVGQAAIASAIDSTPNMGENVGPTATGGMSGTGAAATAAGANAAAAAAANGMSDAAQGAAAQAAASATIGGANAADAATAGGAAAAATQGIADSVAANNAAIGATAASTGGDVSGGDASGPGVGTGSGIGGGDTGGVSGGGGDTATA